MIDLTAGCEPDVMVDVENPEWKESDFFNEWIRIPINGIDEWINKDGPAHINRTAKVSAMNQPTNDTEVFFDGVEIETEYEDGNKNTLDVIFNELLVGDGSDQFPRARVWMYDEQIDEHTVVHHGYVGGYGPKTNSLLRKFYIYDVSDLLRRIPVGQTFSNITFEQLIEFVVAGEDNTDEPVGVDNATPFDVVAVNFPSADELNDKRPVEFEESPDELPFNLDSIFPFVSLAGEILEEFGFSGEQKQFTRNRHNMVDVLNYITSAINGHWYFTPAVEGVILEIRANVAEEEYGREFTDQTVSDVDDEFTVTTLENTALTDITPINSITVNGAQSLQLNDADEPLTVETAPSEIDIYKRLLNRGGNSYLTEKYPRVELTYDPYLERANGTKLGPTNVTVDTDTIEATEKAAYEEFMEHIEQSTEGSIELVGDPFILPYDSVRTPPACNGITPSIDPLLYDVNDVHHRKYAGEPFTTEVGVHAAIEKFDENGDSNFTYNTSLEDAQ